MSWERLYRILQPETSGTIARAFRTAHHTMVTTGIAIMLADTVKTWRQAHHQALDIGFQVACAFFFAEYLLRLVAAPGAPAAYRRGWRARLSWAVSAGGVFDLLGALPGMTAAATMMMKGWMKNARLPDVAQFLDMARESGTKLFACSTTMGVMGVKATDLLPGVDIAGSTAFLDFAADADVSLFV